MEAKSDVINLVKNDMIVIDMLEDTPDMPLRVVITLQREAESEMDVQLCTQGFQKLFQEATKYTPKLLRLRVKTHAVNIRPTQIRFNIIGLIKNFFERHALQYLKLLDRCAIEIANPALAAVIQPIVSVICPNNQKILVTSNVYESKRFLKK